MTRDRDIERALERWFADGPSQMPDQFFDDVLDLVDHVPQRRLARLQTRLLAMNLNLRIAAAAATIVAVSCLGALALNQTTGVADAPTPVPTAVIGPSATPSTTSSASTGQPIPAALRYRWNGPTREHLAGMVPAPPAARIVLTRLSLNFDGGDPATSSALFSSASVDGPHRLRFVLRRDEAGCTAGAIGTYRFTISPGGGYLLLALLDDPCQARFEAIAGTWERSACPTSGGCLGDLEPGEHASANFNPFVPRASYAYSYGRLTYAVPDGWSNTVDGPDGYFLTRPGKPDGGGILAFSTALAASQSVSCPGTVEPGVGKTATALANWLTALPGLVTSAPKSITVGGLSGTTVDVSISPSWTRACPYSEGKPYVPLFTNGNPTDNFDWGLASGGEMRLFLLDLPDGRTMLIDVESPDASIFDALLADATPVIETFEFHP